MLAPCALGGILDDETVPRLRCPIVAGAANNQLADDRIADLLAARGILWAPDFVVNAGGLINIAEELGRLRRRRGPAPGARDRRHAAADLRRRRGERRHAADRGDGARPPAPGRAVTPRPSAPASP